MIKPKDIKERWGAVNFRCPDAQAIADLPLREEDRELLLSIGLPTGPKKEMKLSLRFENVDIIHRPKELRLFIEPGTKKKLPVPNVSPPAKWVDLSKFIVLGEVPNDFKKGSSFFLTRLICLDGIRGYIWWVYPTPSKGKIDCCMFNTSLAGYLESLFAYKEFRKSCTALWKRYPDPDMAVESRTYQTRAKAMHQRFLTRLEAADPVGFKKGFWEEHAWNEAILLAI